MNEGSSASRAKAKQFCRRSVHRNRMLSLVHWRSIDEEAYLTPDIKQGRIGTRSYAITRSCGDTLGFSFYIVFIEFSNRLRKWTVEPFRYSFMNHLTGEIRLFILVIYTVRDWTSSWVVLLWQVSIVRREWNSVCVEFISELISAIRVKYTKLINFTAYKCYIEYVELLLGYKSVFIISR